MRSGRTWSLMTYPSAFATRFPSHWVHLFVTPLVDDGHESFGNLLYNHATCVSILLYLHIAGRAIRPTHVTGKFYEMAQERRHLDPLAGRRGVDTVLVPLTSFPTLCAKCVARLGLELRSTLPNVAPTRESCVPC